MYKKGSIVLVPFPFSDLSSSKVRPAVILSEFAHKEDVVVAFISSLKKQHLHETDILLKSSDRSFPQTGLKTDSIIKTAKIAALDKQLVLGEMGQLGAATEKEINKNLKIIFGL